MDAQPKVRALADTVGFAHTKQQIEAVMQRIEQQEGGRIAGTLNEKRVPPVSAWRFAIAPHDDAYAGYMYPLVLQNIKAKTVIIFGVAHKAAALKLEDQLIFDSYTHWRGPYGNIKVSAMREEVMKKLPKGSFQVNDSMQSMEQSVEAKLPFLQYYNKEVEIISILVPSMSYERMNELGIMLAKAIGTTMQVKKLNWGKDVAFISSTDAVHYGDQDWDGRNFAFFGADTNGYAKAVEYEHKIMNDCFKGELMKQRAKLFTEYTVKKEDHTQYQWTWCGRYSVPFGLLFSAYLQELLMADPLEGVLLGYCTSLDHPHIHVDDLGGMGVTATATLRHWVGYAAVGFR
jgi:MEMO1 family protein